MDCRLTYPTEQAHELILHAREDVDISIGERMDLGLSLPDDFEIITGFYNSQAPASARLSRDHKLLFVNILPFSYMSLDEELQEDADRIMSYFDTVRRVYRDMPDAKVLMMMKDPVTSVRSSVETISRPDYDALEKQFEEMGRPLSWFLDSIQNQAAEILSLIGKVMPAAERIFLGQFIYPFRHEIDHLAYYGSERYRSFLDAMHRKETIEIEFQNDRAGFDPLADACSDLLAINSHVNPEMETRALYFTHVPLGQFRDADLDMAQKKGLSQYIELYVNYSLVEEILPPLFFIHSRGLSRAALGHTANAIFCSIGLKRGTVGMQSLTFRENMDFDLYKKIMFEDLPYWQDVYAANAIMYSEDNKQLYRP